MKTPVQDQIQTLHHVINSGWITDWSAAIDGGANHGEWSEVMSEYFDRTIAFEAAPDTAKVLRKNVDHLEDVTVYERALYSHKCFLEVVHHPKKLSDRARYVCSYADQKKTTLIGQVQAIAIDDLNLAGCGLLKLDIEGAEHNALLGAAETIRKYKPVIIIEINGHGQRFGYSDEETKALVESFGYKLAFESDPDQVYIPD